MLGPNNLLGCCMRKHEALIIGLLYLVIALIDIAFGIWAVTLVFGPEFMKQCCRYSNYPDALLECANTVRTYVALLCVASFFLLAVGIASITLIIHVVRKETENMMLPMIVMMWMQFILGLLACVVAVVQAFVVAGAKVGTLCALMDGVCLLSLAYLLHIFRIHRRKLLRKDTSNYKRLKEEVEAPSDKKEITSKAIK